MLSTFDGGTLVHVTQYDYPDHIDVRPSSISADGAGGAFVAATRLESHTYETAPVITHFSANGQVAWSKAYTLASPDFWNLPTLNGVQGVSTSPDVTISAPVAGKLAVIGGHGAMVIDIAGAVQWAQTFAGQTALSQRDPL